jgi:hypothetical protein
MVRKLHTTPRQFTTREGENTLTDNDMLLRAFCSSNIAFRQAN